MDELTNTDSRTNSSSHDPCEKHVPIRCPGAQHMYREIIANECLEKEDPHVADRPRSQSISGSLSLVEEAASHPRAEKIETENEDKLGQISREHPRTRYWLVSPYGGSPRSDICPHEPMPDFMYRTQKQGGALSKSR